MLLLFLIPTEEVLNDSFKVNRALLELGHAELQDRDDVTRVELLKVGLSRDVDLEDCSKVDSLDSEGDHPNALLTLDNHDRFQIIIIDDLLGLLDPPRELFDQAGDEVEALQMDSQVELSQTFLKGISSLVQEFSLELLFILLP